MLRRAALSSLRSVSRRAIVQNFKALSTTLQLCKTNGVKAPSHQYPVQVALFSSDVSAPSQQMPEREFVELADETLHEIQNWLDGIEEMLDNSDIMFTVRNFCITSLPFAIA